MLQPTLQHPFTPPAVSVSSQTRSRPARSQFFPMFSPASRLASAQPFFPASALSQELAEALALLVSRPSPLARYPAAQDSDPDYSIAFDYPAMSDTADNSTCHVRRPFPPQK